MKIGWFLRKVLTKNFQTDLRLNHKRRSDIQKKNAKKKTEPEYTSKKVCRGLSSSDPPHISLLFLSLFYLSIITPGAGPNFISADSGGGGDGPQPGWEALAGCTLGVGPSGFRKTLQLTQPPRRTTRNQFHRDRGGCHSDAMAVQWRLNLHNHRQHPRTG